VSTKGGAGGSGGSDKPGGNKAGAHKAGGHAASVGASASAGEAGHNGGAGESSRAEPRAEQASTATDPVAKLCREVLAPIVEADGGEMYLVAASAEDIHIHLAGTCSGCPGATLTGDRILAPALAVVARNAKLRVTTGWRVPEGAKRVETEKKP
jgi:Fe-S cluster biogenesis protein NfuA